MKKRQILKALSLLAAVCITAGCNASTAAETTTTAVEITTTTTAEVTSEKNISEFSELAEAEIYYVSEKGRIFYKNYSEWTFERVFEELRINGEKIEAPLTLDKLGEGFKFSDGEYDTSYSSFDGEMYKMLNFNNKHFCSVKFVDCKDENDYNKPFNELELSLSGTSEEYRDDITINGIGIGSTVEEVIEKLGIPNSEFGGGFVYTSQSVTNYYGTISLGFYEGELCAMTISLYDNVN